MTPNIPLLFALQFLLVASDGGLPSFYPRATKATPVMTKTAPLITLAAPLDGDKFNAGAIPGFLPPVSPDTQAPPASTSSTLPSKAFSQAFSTSGHGENATTMTPNIPLLFALQACFLGAMLAASHSTDSWFAA
ncbi:uncharacterized protein ISCGN_026890 [Ixodes scapularis]